MITLRYTSIAIVPSTMPGMPWIPLHGHRPPHQPPCVLASLFHITYLTRPLPYYRRLMVQLGALQLVLLEPFSMNGLPRAPSLFGRLMKSFGSLQCSMFVSQIHKLL